MSRGVKVALGAVAFAGFIHACGGSDRPESVFSGTGGMGGDASSDDAAVSDGGRASGGSPGSGGAPSGACENSRDCIDAPGGPICDRANSVCVDCLAPTDCPPNHECTLRACVPFTPCVNSRDCGATLVCDTAAGRCVECVSNADCGAGEQCIDRKCQTSCDSDLDCTPSGQLCDVAAGICVDCLLHRDCPPAEYCAEATCVADTCTAGHSACVGNGVATCGAEGDGFGPMVPCSAQETCVVDAAGAACASVGSGGAGSGGASSGGAGGVSNTGGAGNPTECTVPNVLYLLVDQSASMSEGGKWTIAQEGINAFLAAPASEGLSVALQLFSVSTFPPSGCGVCDGSDCAVPLVPAAPLPDNQTALSNALVRTPFGLGTPLEAPLRGGISFCAGIQAGNPTVECAVVVVTDGTPTSCAPESDVLAGIAAAGLSSEGVRTFVVGMTGADFVMLDAIATGGGTDCNPGDATRACNATDAGTLAAGLARIRDTVGNCAVP